MLSFPSSRRLFFLRKVFQVHKVFYGPPWPRILLSLFGVDGYFSYKIPNYYQVGEWFLGAIVMLHAVYPLLSFAVNKNKFAMPLLLLGGYAWMLGTDCFAISDNASRNQRRIIHNSSISMSQTIT